MKNTLSILLMTACALSTAQGAVTYSGQLSADDGLHAGGKWDRPSTEISWSIDDITTPGLWHYEYAMSVEEHSLDFLMLEVSDTFTEDNLFNLTSDPSNWSASVIQTSSTGRPWLKIQGDERNRTVTFSFDSDHTPAWGDFYATDGRRKHLYNDGMGLIDPLDAPANGSLNSHILAPGTLAPIVSFSATPTTVPAPGALLLASLGIGLAAKMKRKQWV
jgi:hypothetical protein